MVLRGIFGPKREGEEDDAEGNIFDTREKKGEEDSAEGNILEPTEGK